MAIEPKDPAAFDAAYSTALGALRAAIDTGDASGVAEVGESRFRDGRLERCGRIDCQTRTF